MMPYTIYEPATTELVVEKSRFICELAKVQSEEEAQEFIKQQKKRYWDATHNCSAYILAGKVVAERSNDDGEPSGTAGLPMLEVLRKNSLANVVAVVTRYFGGVKLGAGGLVRAYTLSVAQTVKKAGLAEVVAMGEYSFPWEVGQVGRLLHQFYRQNLFQVGEVVYGARARINLIFPVAVKPQVEAYLTEVLRQEVTLQEERLYGQEQRVENNRQN